MVGVAMKHDVDRVSGERLFQPARAQIGIDLRWLSLHGGGHRGIVQQRHATLGSEPSQSSLQLQGFVQGLLHELLDNRLAPGAKGPSPKSSRKAFDSREPDAEYLVRVPIEYSHPDVAKDASHLMLFAALVVMVAQDGDDW